MFTSRSKNSYIRSPRSVTIAPIDCPLRTLNAAIDFFAHLLGSKSVTDVLSLSAEQARKNFEAASMQNKELWELAQKLATETGEPFRKHAARVFHLGS